MGNNFQYETITITPSGPPAGLLKRLNEQFDLGWEAVSVMPPTLSSQGLSFPIIYKRRQLRAANNCHPGVDTRFAHGFECYCDECMQTRGWWFVWRLPRGEGGYEELDAIYWTVEHALLGEPVGVGRQLWLRMSVPNDEGIRIQLEPKPGRAK